MIPVLAYTNCNSVELFLNGRSMGEKRLEFPAQGTSGGWNTYALPVVNPTTNDLHLTWDVPYEPGVLKAVGKRRDGAVCNDEVRTTGAPTAVRLVADHDTITDAQSDVAHVTFEIVDAAGLVVPTAGDLVHVTVTGGNLLALDNADLQDQSGYRTGERHAFNGRGIAIVRGIKSGILRVDASANGLRSATLSLHVVAGRATPSVAAAR
jgi:beta-galactosidase